MAEKSLIQNHASGHEGGRPALNFPKDSKAAWIALGCGFCTQIIILGVLHAFGVFFIVFIRDFQTTKANAAWVGSIAYGLSMLTGPLAGIVINKFGHRVSMICGGLLCFIALLSSSFVNSLNHLFFTFSFIYGLGTCLCITPTMTLGQDYFEKYLSVSIGIITSGSSIGTLVMAPTSQALIDSVGWRNTFRIYAVACLLTSLFNFFVRPISNTKKTASETLRSSPLRRLIQELALWKNRVFIVWATGITLVMFGYYIPYVHLISFALDAGITPDQGSILIMVFGASTAIGRLTFGKIVQLGLLNRLHMHQLSMIVCGTATMFLPFIQSFGGLLSYVVFFGMVDGCFVVLLPLMTCSLVQADKAVLAWGFLSGTSSITFTLGPPIAGFIYDSLGSYNVAFHVASIPVIAGALVLFLIPWAQRTSITTCTMEAVGAVIETESDVDVDFITLSRSSSVVPRNQCSDATLASRLNDIRYYNTPSASPRSLRTISSRGISESRSSPRTPVKMIEIDYAMRALEQNDQLLSEMLEAASRRTADTNSIGRSITSSKGSSSRKSDIINISLSSNDGIRKQSTSSRSKKSYDNIGVQTDNISETSSNFFLPTASNLHQTEAKQNNAPSIDGGSKMSNTSMLDSYTPGSIDQSVLEQIERLRDTISSPTRAAELMEDPSPQWIESPEQSEAQTASKTSSPGKDVNSTPMHFVEALVPAETTSCALSPKTECLSSVLERSFAIQQTSTARDNINIKSEHDIFSMDPLSPPRAIPIGGPDQEASSNRLPNVTSPLSTNPFHVQPDCLSSEALYGTLTPVSLDDVTPVVADTRVTSHFQTNNTNSNITEHSLAKTETLQSKNPETKPNVEQTPPS